MSSGSAVLLLLLASAAAPAAAESKHARDGSIAIAEEFCRARASGKREAYDLFIARHPEHPLARIARAERGRASHAAHRNDCEPAALVDEAHR